MLDKIILEKLNNLWEIVKNDTTCLKITGSYLNPYIKVHHDIDMICSFNSTEARRNFISKYLINDCPAKQILDDLKQNYNLMILTNITPSFWAYINNWVYPNENSILFGNDPEYNKVILENKEEYLEIAEASLNGMLEHYEKTGRALKTLYHILTGLYIIEDNSYDLTEEQIQRINDVHDQVSQELMVNALYEARDLLNELKK